MITPRLEKILQLTKKEIIADIGTDHAYIPIKLALDGRIKKAFACDKNEGPLLIAKKNIDKYCLSDKIECRLGSGLFPIKQGEAEEIIIAGMGGKLIGDILEENIETAFASTLILQPMNAQYELRKRLFRLGFTVVKEELECEGRKIYNFMIVKKGIDTVKDEFSYHIPDVLLNHPLISMLINKKKREFTKIIDGKKLEEKKDEKIITYYMEMLEKLNVITK